ncbi:MAG: hypothetical protein AAFR35_04080 [Pseudomonadota bacterium]
MSWQATVHGPLRILDPVSGWFFNGRRQAALNRRFTSLRPITHYIVAGGANDGTSGTEMFAGASIMPTEAAIDTLPAPSDGSLRPEAEFAFLMPIPLGPDEIGTAAAADLAADALTPAPRQPKAIVLVVDNAISVGHERFRKADGTSRVEGHWVMDARHGTGDPVPFGRFFDKAAIDGLISEHGDDVDGVLAAMGQAPAETMALPIAWSNTAHGTQIADLAAGLSPDDAKANDIALLTAQLPTLVYWAGTGDTMGYFVIAALQQMLRYARARFPGVPVVATLSYSIAGGPHNGTHYIERAMDRVLDDHAMADGAGPVIPILPAGNTYDGQRHARARIDAGTELLWRILPGDRSPNVLEIWVPSDAAATVEVTTPSGASTVADTAGKDLIHNGETVARAIDEGLAYGDLRRISVIVGPTDTAGFVASDPVPGEDRSGLDPALGFAAAPVGTWRVTISGSDPRLFQAWIHRDDQDFGFQAVEPQSYLDDPIYEAQLKNRPAGQPETTVPDLDTCMIKRSGSLSGMAGSRSTWIVAAARMRDGRLAKYSSAANYAQGIRKFAPLLSTAADVSIVRPGQLAASNRYGTRRWRSGTSAAVPVLARQLAMKIADGADAAALAANPEAAARPDSLVAVLERDGYGYLATQPIAGANAFRVGEFFVEPNEFPVG